MHSHINQGEVFDETNHRIADIQQRKRAVAVKNTQRCQQRNHQKNRQQYRVVNRPARELSDRTLQQHGGATQNGQRNQIVPERENAQYLGRLPWVRGVERKHAIEVRSTVSPPKRKIAGGHHAAEKQRVFECSPGEPVQQRQAAKKTHCLQHAQFVAKRHINQPGQQEQKTRWPAQQQLTTRIGDSLS